MVRPLRILFEGATYHIFSKGNLDDFILLENKDKGYFLKLLGIGAEKFCVDVLNYCLMGNHYHLLARTQKANLPGFMHFLLSSYASYQARQGRKGHIFAGRYKAILINTEEYLLTVSKYIHLNPVKAALVDNPSEYRWSSYKYYLPGSKIPDWVDRKWLLDFFGPGLCESLKRYKEFVETDLEAEFPYPQENVVARAILGNEDFVKEAIAKHQANIASKEITRKKELLRRLSLEEIQQKTCSYYHLNDLRKNAFKASGNYQRARRSFIYLAREYTDFSNAEIANAVGDIGPSGVSESYRRTARLVDLNAQLKKEIGAIGGMIFQGVSGTRDPVLKMEA